MIGASNTATFCRIKINTLLFSISIISIVLDAKIEGISQIILIIKAMMPYSSSCEATYADLQTAVNHFTYFHRSDVCGTRVMKEFFTDNVNIPNLQIKGFLITHSYATRQNNSRIAKFVFVYLRVANLLDALMIFFNIPLFTASFCISQLNRCKMILIPWIIVMFLVIMFDLVTMPIIITNYARCQVLSGWLRQMEFDYEMYYQLASYDGIAAPFVKKYLINFAEILLAISIRHLFTIPLFIAYLIIITKLCYHLYKVEAREKMLQAKRERSHIRLGRS